MSDGFIFYSSFLEATRDLDDAQFGAAMRAITEYGINGTVPEEMDAITRIVFTLVRPQIDANSRRRTNGSKGGRPAKPAVSEEENHRLPEEKTNGSSDEKPKEKEKEKVKEKVKEKEKDKANEKVKENPTPLPPSGGDGAVQEPFMNPPEPDPHEELFESFWSAYPKKQGKGDARKSFAKIKPSKALTKQMIDAVERAKGSIQWQRNHGQYIPNPATWLNQERWLDDVPQDMGLPDLKTNSRFHNLEQRPADDIDQEAIAMMKARILGKGAAGG